MTTNNVTPISGTVPQPVEPSMVRKLLDPIGLVKEAIDKTTKDLYLAAALHSEGCKYIRVDKSEPTRMVFVFEGGENADRVEREWYSRTLAVSAYDYASSIRMMKSVIHS